MKTLWENLFALIRERTKESLIARIGLVLSIIVVFCTTYILVLPALTLSNTANETVLQEAAPVEETVTEMVETVDMSEEVPETSTVEMTTVTENSVTTPSTQEKSITTQTTTVTEATTESESTKATEAGSFKAETNDAVVTVTYGANTFKEQVTLEVKPLTNATAYEEKINDLLNEQNQSLTKAYAYDIAFKNKKGKEIEPLKAVTVSIDFKNKVSQSGQLQSGWKFYHFKEDSLEVVEDLTDEKHTVITETEKGDVTSIDFKSDSFSPYVLAGVEYADFTNYLTPNGATIEGGATFTESTKLLTARINLKFSVPQKDLVQNNNYFLHLPNDTGIDEKVLTFTDTYHGYDDNNNLAFDFKFVKKPEGGVGIQITFKQDYINGLSPGGLSAGYLSYKAGIGLNHKNEDGSYSTKYKDDVELKIPSSEITKINDNPGGSSGGNQTNQEKDFTGYKSAGTPQYTGFDTAYIDYTVKIESNNGSPDKITLTDVLNAGGLTIGSLKNVTVTNQSGQTVNPINQNLIKGSFSMTLPQLRANESYTLTYRYEFSGIKSDTGYKVSNRVTGTSGGKTAPFITETWINKTSKVRMSKYGHYDKDSDTIKWTITVNPDHANIAGKTLTDSMFNQVSQNDMIISPKEGARIVPNWSGKVTSVQFDAIKNDINDQTYTITYTTKVDRTNLDWSGSVQNDTTITGGDKASYAVNVGKPGTGDIVKSFQRVDDTSDMHVKTLNWSITLKLPPKIKVIPKHTEFSDTLHGLNETANAKQHWYTASQIRMIFNQFETAFGRGNIEVKAIDGNWQRALIKDLNENTHYIGYVVKLLTEYKGTNDVTLNYASTADVSTTSNFSNKFLSGHHAARADYKYVKQTRITKMNGDGNQGVTDTSVNEPGGNLNWLVEVDLDDTNKTVTVIDNLPKNVTLVTLNYGSRWQRWTAKLNNSVLSSGTEAIWKDNQRVYLDLTGSTDNDGKLSVTITAPKGKTLKSQIPKTDDPKFNGKLYIGITGYYNTGVIDAMYSTKVPVTNKVSVIIDGESGGSDEQTQNVNINSSQKLKKEGSWNNNDRTINYSLTLNSGSQDLNPNGDTYIVKDVLSYTTDTTSNISYNLVQDSVKLVDSATNKEVPKSDYPWILETSSVGSGRRNILKITIPDNHAYKLYYSYRVSAPGLSITESKDFTVDNSATIENLKNINDFKWNNVQWREVGASAGITSDKFYQITKVDTANYGIVLPNAVFEVRENLTDKVVATYKTGANGTFYITKDNKNALPGSSGLLEDRLYYAIEVEAPTGYELPEDNDSKRFFFYYSTSNKVPVNSGTGMFIPNEMINLAKQSKQVFVENEKLPEDTSITVEKIWQNADGQKTNRVDGQIEITLKQVALKVDGTTQEKDIKKAVITFADNWRKTFDRLPIQGRDETGENVTYTYYVVEKTVAGYTTSYSDIMNTGIISENPKEFETPSGGIRIINKANKAYILPNTGGIGPEKLLWIGFGLSVLVATALGYRAYKEYQGGGLL